MHRTVGWGAAVLLGLTVLVWLVSFVLEVRWHDGRRVVLDLDPGALRYASTSKIKPGDVETGLTVCPMWRLKTWTDAIPADEIGWLRGPAGWVVELPLCYPAAALLLVMLAARSLRKRQERTRTTRGLCLQCGYERSGVRSGAPCPECAAVPRLAENTRFR